MQLSLEYNIPYVSAVHRDLTVLAAVPGVVSLAHTEVTVDVVRAGSAVATRVRLTLIAICKRIAFSVGR